jgi:hypothetical protein
MERFEQCRTTAPVIHLAAAMAVVGQERGGRAQTCLDLLLLSSDFIKEIIQRALLFAELIDKSPHFPVKAERLVRLSLC